MEKSNKTPLWYQNTKGVRVHKDRVAVKLVNRDGSFKKAVVVPTEMYPLNAECRVFTEENCKEVTDLNILQIYDSIKYQIGHCYTNAGKLCEELQKAGYEAKTYAGWLFTSPKEFPVHHCWVVIGDSVLDLADDFRFQFASGYKANSYEEQSRLLVAYTKYATTVKNSERCYPVGVPTDFMLYVGSECDSEYAKKIYSNLMKRYPNHECQRNCNGKGLNQTQKMLYQEGLMIV